MKDLFAAAPDLGLTWRETIWPEEPALVIVADDNGARRLTRRRWGLPPEAFAQRVPAKQRGTLYPRDVSRGVSRLNDPAGLSRCLIVMEAFAYPADQDGVSTRSWFGVSDHPLLAWAGYCGGDRCAGLLVGANALIEPSSSTMPRLLIPPDHADWLAGAALLSLGPSFDDECFYCERLGERWSTGRIDDRALLGTARVKRRRTKPRR